MRHVPVAERSSRKTIRASALVRRALLAAVLCLAGCDVNDANRRAIADQCLAGGEQEAVCTCLASESVTRLDPPLLEIVVMGARQEQTRADQRLKALDPVLKSKFETEIPLIVTTCSANAGRDKR